MERKERSQFNVLKKELPNVIRFCVTGGISTLADFLVYKYILSIGINAIFAKMVSMGAVLFCSFYINKKWTFQFIRKPKTGEFLRYILCQAINMFVNIGFNTIFIMLTKKINLSFVLSTGVAMAVNFLLQRCYVFGGEY